MDYTGIFIEDKIVTYDLDKEKFNEEYLLCRKNGAISNTMGNYLLAMCNNAVSRYAAKYNSTIIEEMHQYILFKMLAIFFKLKIGNNPFPVVSVVLFNESISFMRRSINGAFDIYGTRIKPRQRGSERPKFIGIDELNI